MKIKILAIFVLMALCSTMFGQGRVSTTAPSAYFQINVYTPNNELQYGRWLQNVELHYRWYDEQYNVYSQIKTVELINGGTYFYVCVHDYTKWTHVEFSVKGQLDCLSNCHCLTIYHGGILGLLPLSTSCADNRVIIGTNQIWNTNYFGINIVCNNTPPGGG